MLKNQRFSSLFRHYAKHHGLRKDDLAYYFTEELQNEDTPETVFLLVSSPLFVVEVIVNDYFVFLSFRLSLHYPVNLI